uniref:Ovule protein n=1 Tax=Ascaris lumbricoides TaxID=6252 RepID=A0A0M3IHD8_ASCLU
MEKKCTIYRKNLHLFHEQKQCSLLPFHMCLEYLNFLMTPDATPIPDSAFTYSNVGHLHFQVVIRRGWSKRCKLWWRRATSVLNGVSRR